MKYPECKVKMISIYGYSYLDPCAIGFMGSNPDKKDSPVNIVYCPSCGLIKVNLKQK